MQLTILVTSPIWNIKKDSMKMNDIDSLLKERQKTHGKFQNVSDRFSKLFEAAFSNYKWGDRLTPSQFTSIVMDLSKLARIIEGDANFLDHWIDRSGYIKCAVDDLMETFPHE